MNGLRLSLETDGFEFKIEGIGFGNNPKSVIDGIQKLINQEGVHMTTGLLGHKGIADVCDFVQGMDEVLIYADLGAVVPQSLKNYSSVYCNSLGLYESVVRLTDYFVENNLDNIGVSTCYFDSGYGFIESMERGFVANSKGGFAGHFITPLHPRENEAELMKEFVEECKPSALFASHNGIFAKEHASYLKENRIHETCALYTLPFSTGDDVLTEYGEVLDGIYSVSSWFKEMEVEGNKQFIKEYSEEYGKSPSVFSVLGYENGLLIKQYLDKHELSESVNGPRGILKVNKETNRINYTHYLSQLRFSNGECKRSIMSALPDRSGNVELRELADSEGVGGWDNAYLCH